MIEVFYLSIEIHQNVDVVQSAAAIAGICAAVVPCSDGEPIEDGSLVNSAGRDNVAAVVSPRWVIRIGSGVVAVEIATQDRFVG